MLYKAFLLVERRKNVETLKQVVLKCGRYLLQADINKEVDKKVAAYSQRMLKRFIVKAYILLPRLKISNKERELNFYFHTSLRCLKRFYEGL